MPDTIQPGEHSTGSGTDGTSHNSSAFNRWNDERIVNVNRNDNDWNDNWWFAGRRNCPSLRTPALLRAFVFLRDLAIPPTQLPACVFKWRREQRVLIRLKRTGFPEHRKQYVQGIELAYRKPYPRFFFGTS